MKRHYARYTPDMVGPGLRHAEGQVLKICEMNAFDRRAPVCHDDDVRAGLDQQARERR